ncbi:MAG: hypothetical protein EA344_11395 [Alkalicoccus sp.]|nr:MAG: hypothetical protein EA344_11395 [Alkalicoccus sp.]
MNKKWFWPVTLPILFLLVSIGQQYYLGESVDFMRSFLSAGILALFIVFYQKRKEKSKKNPGDRK